VNAWLENQGVAYRWRVTNATPTTGTLTPQSAPELPAANVSVHAVSSPENDRGKLGGQVEVDLIRELRNDPIIGLHYRAEITSGRNMWMDDNSRKEHNRGIVERFNIGRYTLWEAAQLISENGKLKIDAPSLVKNLVAAIMSGKLKCYARGYENNWLYKEGESIRPWYLECYWLDLNVWLNETEPQITFRLGDPKHLSVDGKLTPHAAQASPATVPVPAVSSPTIVPVQRSASQDAAIIAEITRLGHDPLALPKNDSGKPGVKAEVWKTLLSDTANFSSNRVFRSAWQRLRNNQKIVDASPYPAHHACK
jgi:hypothetical protein